MFFMNTFQLISLADRMDYDRLFCFFFFINCTRMNSHIQRNCVIRALMERKNEKNNERTKSNFHRKPTLLCIDKGTIAHCTLQNAYLSQIRVPNNWKNDFVVIFYSAVLHFSVQLVLNIVNSHMISIPIIAFISTQIHLFEPTPKGISLFFF